MGYVRVRGCGHATLQLRRVCILGFKLKAVVREAPRSHGRIALSPGVILLAQEGDEQAWNELFKRIRPIVRQVSYDSSGAWGSELDDLEAFVWWKLWVALNKYKHGNFIAWVYSVIRNAVHNWQRARRRHYRRHVEWPERFNPATAVRLDNAVVARSEIQRALGRIEREMSLTTRRAVEMSAEGWSGKEISKELGISHNSVKQRCHRARARFVSET